MPPCACPRATPARAAERLRRACPTPASGPPRQARSDDVGQLRQAFRVAEVAAEPAREDLGDVRERPPLEHGYVFDDARRSKARHRRAGGAPGLVEPAPTLLVERNERLAEQ